MPLGLGARLGPYEIQSAIGAGGMGEVYKARDTRLDRIVAIKILPDALTGDPQFRERFAREARAISQLDHPHICTLHDVGEQNGTSFLVMQYLEGETLEARLKKGALPLDHALQVAIQIADALDKAHRAGIVHRDLKPGNIMLVRRGGPSGPPDAKLLDFGLAKTTAAVASAGLSMLPTTPPATMTARGTILGTLQYMSPEQLEGAEADPRADVFAFGAVLYEMVTGTKAFEGKSQASLIAAILDREPSPLSGALPTAPEMLDRVVKKCLAKQPDERWQSATDLHDALKWIAEGTGGVSAANVPTRSHSRWVWALGGAAAAALVALGARGAVTFRRAAPEPIITRLDVITPPTSDAFSFALSPDGRQLAFVASGERGSQLWLRSLDRATAQPLAGTEGASYPFWAPDSRVIGFFAEGKVKRVDLGGGAPQSLADAPYPRGGTWNADGVIVYAPSIADPLMRVAATGGTAAPVTRLAPGQGSHRWPQFLPDGRRFLFLMTTGQSQTQGVYVGSLEGDEPKRVMPAEIAAMYAAPGYLLVVSQGVLTAHAFDAGRATVTGEPIPLAQAVGADDGAFHSAFSVSAAGVLAHRTGASARTQLVWVDRTGKMLAVGQPDENASGNPALAPDGQRVALSRNVQGNYDLWLIETSRGAASRFTFDGAIENSPVWSPDGRQIAFRSNRKGVHDLFEKPAGGTADEQPLLVTSQAKSPLDWSPDGRLLLYGTQDPKTGSDLWVLPMMGERKPFAVLQSSSDEIEGQFSPDGRWLAYASNESGRYEIYVRSFPEAGGKWQVSVGGGLQPRWKLDGRELFYVAPDSRLMAAPIRLVPETHALEAGTPEPLFRTQLATGPNIAPAGFQARAQYAVAADGRFLMNSAADEGVRSPITIVQNWTAAL